MRITLTNITRHFGKQAALIEVSAEIPGCAITTLLGPNGAGKTTLMRILAGRILPDSGTYEIEGLDPANTELKKRMIGYLPENNPLYKGMYVSELMEFQSSVYKLPHPQQSIDRIVQELELEEVLHRKTGQLSKGTQQRVGLAQVLLPDPKILILDEPSNGLDPMQHEQLRNLLNRLKTDKTILLSTHLLNEVQDISDHTLILNQGRLVSQDTSVPENPGEKVLSEIHLEFEQALSPDILQQFPLPILSLDGNKLIAQGEAADRPKLFTFAVEHQLVLIEIQIRNQSLLDQYHQVTLK